MKKIVGVACIAAILSGCVTTGSDGSQTAMQKAIGQCILTVGAGAILGVIVGGRRNAGSGALIGAGLGAGLCAVLMEFASREDQARIREQEQRAVAANQTTTTNFQTKSGSQAQVTTTVQEAPASAAPAKAGSPNFTACRYSETTAQIGAQTASAGRQLWCRSNVGDWEPVA